MRGTVTKSRNIKLKSSLKSSLTGLSILTFLTLSGCSQEDKGMHITGQSYLHKEVIEERVEIVEEVRSSAVKNAGMLFKHIGYALGRDRMTSMLTEETGQNMTDVQKAVDGGKMLFPLSKATLTSHVGPRYGTWHFGIDFGADPMTPIYAAHDAKVEKTGYMESGLGNYIYITGVFNGKETTTIYGHMAKPSTMKAGDMVKRGDIIGYVGNTGTSTGPHLHFEVRVPDKANYLLMQEYTAMEITIMKSRIEYNLNNYAYLNPANFFEEISKTTPAGTQIISK